MSLYRAEEAVRCGGSLRCSTCRRAKAQRVRILKGYVTTGALITPQTVEAGTIQIQVIEGNLQEIKIVGNRRLQSKYIRSRIQIGAGKPLNVPRLLEKLQLLRLNPRIQNLNAELQTGVRPGTNVLRVEKDCCN